MIKTIITMSIMLPILRPATPFNLRSKLSRLHSRMLLIPPRLDGQKEFLMSEQTAYLRKNKLISNLQQLHKTLKLPWKLSLMNLWLVLPQAIKEETKSLIVKHNPELPEFQLKLRLKKLQSMQKLMPKSLKSKKSISTMTHGNFRSLSKILRTLELMHGPGLQKDYQKLRNYTKRKVKNSKLPLSKFFGNLTKRVKTLLTDVGLL